MFPKGAPDESLPCNHLETDRLAAVLNADLYYCAKWHGEFHHAYIPIYKTGHGRMIKLSSALGRWTWLTSLLVVILHTIESLVILKMVPLDNWNTCHLAVRPET